MPMNDYVIKKADIDAMAGLDKSHFLNPDARRKNKSLGDLTGLTGLGFHIIEVEPGYWSTEYHVHYFEDECTYILSGTAEVKIGTQTHTVEAGDFIGYRKGGEPHTMKNTGSETLVCIVTGQRADHDVGYYPDKGKRLFRSQGLPWSMADDDAIEHPQGGAQR